MGGNYVPLYIFLGLLIFIGIAIPLILGDLIETENINQNSFSAPIVDVITNPINIEIPLVSLFVGATDINIIDWFPQSIQESIKSYAIKLTYVPDVIAIPAMIIMLISLIWAVLMLARGT